MIRRTSIIILAIVLKVSSLSWVIRKYSFLNDPISNWCKTRNLFGSRMEWLILGGAFVGVASLDWGFPSRSTVELCGGGETYRAGGVVWACSANVLFKWKVWANRSECCLRLAQFNVPYIFEPFLAKSSGFKILL